MLQKDLRTSTGAKATCLQSIREIDTKGQFHQHFFATLVRTDPKSEKIIIRLSVFFVLLGSEGIKAAQ